MELPPPRLLINTDLDNEDIPTPLYIPRITRRTITPILHRRIVQGHTWNASFQHCPINAYLIDDLSRSYQNTEIQTATIDRQKNLINRYRLQVQQLLQTIQDLNQDIIDITENRQTMIDHNQALQQALQATRDSYQTLLQGLQQGQTARDTDSETESDGPL